MRRITSSLVAVGAVAGLVGAVVTYQAASSATATEQPVAAPAAATSVTPEVTTVLLPCEKGSRLVKGVCIRTEHRTVIRERPAPAVAPAASARSGSSSRGPRRGDDGSPRNDQGVQGRGDDSGDDRDDRDDDHDEDRDDDRDEDHEEDRDEDEHEDD